MKGAISIAILAVICALATVGYALTDTQGKTVTKTDPDPLAGLGWMSIPSTEHTGEYLVKTGAGGGDASMYTGWKVAGNWSLELRDLRDRMLGKAELQLFQIGTIVYGSGTLQPSGITATVNGAILENSMSLGMVTVPQVALYRMKMSLADNSSTGSFDAYNAAGGSIEGNVYGKMSAERTLS